MAKKLLLADDSVTIQKVVNLTFADEGIEVITVSDGNAAVDVLSTSKPDIVIADVNMPGLNGYQLCEKIKTDEALKDIPVILLVGSFEPFDEEKARKVGADDLLTKPFQSIRQLISKVSTLLEARKASGEREVKPEGARQELASQENAYESEFEGFAVVAEDETIHEETLSTFEQPQTTYEEKTERDLAVTTPLSAEDIKEIQSELSPATVNTSDNVSTEVKSETVSVSEVVGSSKTALPETSLEPSKIASAPTKVTAELSEVTGFVNVTSSEVKTEKIESKGVEKVEISTEDQKVGKQELEEGKLEEEKIDKSTQTTETELAVKVSPAAVYDESLKIQERASVTGYQEEGQEKAIEETNRIEEKKFEFEKLAQEVPSPEKVTLLESDEDNILELPLLSEVDVSTETALIEEKLEERTQEKEGIQREREEKGREIDTAKPQTIILPPEIIDAIAEKVVEKFAEKAIREIAWEIVPQQAELIIKKMVEEQLKKQKTGS